jgi:hypothetical protein
MREAGSIERTPLERAVDALHGPSRVLFSLAIIALGIETFACAGSLAGSLIESDRFGPIVGPILAACGACLLFKRTARTAAMALGSLLLLCSLFFEVRQYAAAPGNIAFRTVLLEPLAIAALAWLLPGQGAVPSWLDRASRYLLAVCFIVFGVDHFLSLSFIGTFIPQWIPWHAFWSAFFGVAFIAAGLSIGLNILLPWGAACIGLMFAIWVFTLHLPRTLFGLYGGEGPHAPDEWSSLFIAVALWAGSWALASFETHTRAS